MPTEQFDMKYTNVIFKFDEDNGTSSELRGVVIVRDTEMVLEVEWPGDLPYLIRGKDCGGFYNGFHEAPADDTDVQATWTRSGDTCQGTWVEDTYQSRFSFRLPPSSPPRTSK
jgi:hypothetical protein